MMIWKILMISFNIFAAIIAEQRIECRWGEEYLCGDKCLRYDHTCFCGNETISYSGILGYDSYDYYCCAEHCYLNYDANVVCHGRPTLWNELCGDKCAQNAKQGWTMVKCQNQNICYLTVSSCIGIAMCEE